MKNSEFYLNAYEKYGISARGLNWNSDASQKIRFEVITYFIQNELSSCSVVDAGCGFADLYLFWEEKGLRPKSYIGIDSVQNSINISKKRLKKFPSCSFTCRDILKDELYLADWYIASGSLNVLSDFDTWLFLEKILSYSKKGIIFNILKGEKKSETFNYQNRENIIQFAKEKDLKIRVIEDYLKNDMSIEIRK
ncbi:class I SAM-dependent methyltransferase [Sulfurospirillum arcachonense]|uniref:class I SAM-dependent methyltransferase n=1 Tax=Sulfurospirillum arcachonense TaxID=57666 RepID=UPI00046A2444|nr:class I SAM-dependent methyltransferase [Sulfurospirillum arcachonense]